MVPPRSGSRRRFALRRGLLAAGAALAVAVGACTVAHATSASGEPMAFTAHAQVTSYKFVRFTGSDGPDRVVVDLWETGTPGGGGDAPEEELGYAFTVHDSVDITTGEGCIHPGGDRKAVTCTVPPPDTSGDPDVPEMEMNLGDGDDHVIAHRDFNTTVHGGHGDDVLLGSGIDELYGDGGRDRLHGNSAHGGPGADVLTGCRVDCHP